MKKEFLVLNFDEDPDKCDAWKENPYDRKKSEEYIRNVFVNATGEVDKVQLLTNDGHQLNDIEDANIEGVCFFQDLRDRAQYDRHLHNQLLKIGKEIELHRDGINEMPTPMINAIVETLKYFGLDEHASKNVYWELKKARYRIWDWLGMAYTGRLEVEHDSQVFQCIEKMVKLYIAQKDVGGFCWFLRGHDLEVEEPHRCEDCIRSYKSWIKDVKEQGKNPDEYT